MFISRLLGSFLAALGSTLGEKAAKPVERILYSSLLTEEKQKILMDLKTGKRTASK